MSLATSSQRRADGALVSTQPSDPPRYANPYTAEVTSSVVASDHQPTTCRVHEATIASWHSATGATCATKEIWSSRSEARTRASSSAARRATTAGAAADSFTAATESRAEPSSRPNAARRSPASFAALVTHRFTSSAAHVEHATTTTPIPTASHEPASTPSTTSESTEVTRPGWLIDQCTSRHCSCARAAT